MPREPLCGITSVINTKCTLPAGHLGRCRFPRREVSKPPYRQVPEKKRIRKVEEGYCEIIGENVVFTTVEEPGLLRCTRITEYEIEVEEA